MAAETAPAWWKGERGEWYVVIQFALAALVVAGPRSVAGWPAGSLPTGTGGRWLGGALMLGGFLLGLAGVLHLGRNLTPLPRPRAEGRLVEAGAYAIVRHPIYGSLCLAAVGWALMVGSWLTLLYAAVLIVFFDIKARREERWLVQKYPEYAAYQRRVRKLIPLVY